MRTWRSRTAGGLPTSFWFLWWGTLVNRLTSFVLIFMVLFLTSDRHLPDTVAGLAVTVCGTAGLFGAALGGHLADVWGRRQTITTGELLSAAAILNLMWARGTWSLLLAAAVFGGAITVGRPAFAALMTDIVPEGDRMRAFGLTYWAVNLGVAFSAPLIGVVAQSDFQAVLILDALTCVIFAGVICLMPAAPTPPAQPNTVTPSTPGRSGVRGDRVFLTFTLLTTPFSALLAQATTTMPLAMQDNGLSRGDYGIVLALNGLLIVLLQLLVTRASTGSDHSRVLALAYTLVGVGFGLMTWAQGLWMYALCVVVWTAGEMLQAPAAAALSAALSPPTVRGRYQAAVTVAASAGAILGPVTGAGVVHAFGGAALWTGCMVIGLAAGAGQLVAGPARRRRCAPPISTTPPSRTNPAGARHAA